MPSQIVLSWDVDVSGTSFGTVAAATALAAVSLYQNASTDPVLGQFFGLSVANDVTAPSGPSVVTRTLTLNMDATQGVPFAPPPFPCHPRTATPPTLPYPLRRQVTLPGSFFPTNGLASVPTTETQEPSLSIGGQVQFLSQIGVYYTILSITPTAIGLTAPYTGVTGSTGAFKEVAAPASVVAIYSTSDLDTNGVATDPVIPAGPGARTVTIAYVDSAGNADSVTVGLTGRRPATVTLAPGTTDIAQITLMAIATTGAFGNSVGQITLCELSDTLPPILSDRTPEDFAGTLTDEAQLLIERQLAYLPPSYSALAQQSAAAPSLEGDFFVTTGSKGVPTSDDQTGALVAGNTVEFASQPGTRYVLDQVTDRALTLTTVYTGIDTNNTGVAGDPNINAGTQGNLGKEVTNKRTGARLVVPLPAAPPTNPQLATLLAEYVQMGTAAPDGSFPTPTFLSDLFTRQIRLALAGAAVTAQPISFI